MFSWINRGTLWPKVQERHGPVRAGPEEGHENRQWGTSLWRQAERAGIVSLEKRKLWANLVVAFQYIKGTRKKERGLFARACSDRTRNTRFELKEGRVRLNIRKKIFTMRIARH